MIDGVMYYVSGWIKQGSKGQFLSLAFKRKEEQHPNTQKPRPNNYAAAKGRDPISTGSMVGLDDDVPFAPEFR
jgi:hypothetical protein